MTELLSEPQKNRVFLLLRQSGLLQSDGEGRFEYLAGDGSDRVFVRIKQAQGPACLVVLPNASHPKGVAEAHSYYNIGKFLFDCGVPVPKLLGYDQKTGIVIIEDLGDLLLHELIVKHSASSEIVWKRYQEALHALVQLQMASTKGFKAEYCWDSPAYDKQVMLERESYYFRSAFCENYLGANNFDSGLEGDFQRLAQRAFQEPASFLLHRDFQSRNLMIHQDRLRIIDFQGARFGPLGYDLASLLIDPYAGLTTEQQNELLDYYCILLEQHNLVDQQSFIEGYYYLFLQRNLQILGAFAFLSQQKGKVFFKKYIKPAAISLCNHLGKIQGAQFPALQSLADSALSLLEKNSSL